MENSLFKKEERKCCVCDKKLFGRSDKVFCDIHCKNKYHAEMRKHTKTASVETTKILNKNYAILCVLLGENCKRFKVKKLHLETHGFNFQTISGLEKTTLGQKMKIYEFSWYYSKDDNIVVLRDSEQSAISPFVYKRWENQYKKLQTKN
jgi:hypothetical protein